MHVATRHEVVLFATLVPARTYAGLDLTQARFGVLFCLHFRGPADQSAVARKFGLDKATLGLVISGLERRGLIARKRCETDRRRLKLSITGVGRILFRRAEKRSLRFRESLMGVVTPEDAAPLLRLLSAFVQAHQRRP